MNWNLSLHLPQGVALCVWRYPMAFMDMFVILRDSSDPFRHYVGIVNRSIGFVQPKILLGRFRKQHRAIFYVIKKLSPHLACDWPGRWEHCFVRHMKFAHSMDRKNDHSSYGFSTERRDQPRSAAEYNEAWRIECWVSAVERCICGRMENCEASLLMLLMP